MPRLMPVPSRALRALALAAASACGGDEPVDFTEEIDPSLPPVEDGTWYRPAVATTWQVAASGNGEHVV